jgi:hypothetical protein
MADEKLKKEKSVADKIKFLNPNSPTLTELAAEARKKTERNVNYYSQHLKRATFNSNHHVKLIETVDNT